MGFSAPVTQHRGARTQPLLPPRSQNRARNWAMHLPTFSPRHFIAEYIVQTRGSSHCPVFFTQVWTHTAFTTLRANIALYALSNPPLCIGKHRIECVLCAAMRGVACVGGAIYVRVCAQVTIPLPGCDEDDGDLVAYALGHSKVKSKHEAARLAMLDPRMSMYVRQFHGRKRPHATLLHEALLQAALPRLQAERPDLAAVVAPQFVLPPPEYPQIPRIPQPPSCPPPANVVRSPKLEPSSSPAGVPRSPQPPPHSPSVGAVRGPQPPPYPPPAGAVRGPQPPPYPPPAGVARGPRPPPYPPPAHLAQPAPLLLTAPPSATPPMPQAPPPSPADSSPSPPSSPQPGGHGLASDSTGAEDSHGYSPQPAGAAERAALRALGATVGCKTEPREPSPEPDSPPVINVRGVVYTADGAAPAKRQRVHPAQAPASVAAAAAAAAPGITTCVVKVEPDSDDDNHIGAVLLGLGEYMDSEMQSRTSPCALLMPPAPPQPSQTPTRSLRPAARAAAARPSPTSL